MKTDGGAELGSFMSRCNVTRSVFHEMFCVVLNDMYNVVLFYLGFREFRKEPKTFKQDI